MASEADKTDSEIMAKRNSYASARARLHRLRAGGLPQTHLDRADKIAQAGDVAQLRGGLNLRKVLAELAVRYRQKLAMLSE